MDDEMIFNTLKKVIEDVIGIKDNINRSNSLKEMGANSIDRAEILVQLMEKLNVQIPLVSFGGAKNIDDIIHIFKASIK